MTALKKIEPSLASHFWGGRNYPLFPEAHTAKGHKTDVAHSFESLLRRHNDHGESMTQVQALELNEESLTILHHT